MLTLHNTHFDITVVEISVAIFFFQQNFCEMKFQDLLQSTKCLCRIVNRTQCQMPRLCKIWAPISRILTRSSISSAMLSTWFTLNLNCPCMSAWLVYQYVFVCWTRIAYLNIARLEDNATHIPYITPRMCGRSLIRNHFLNMFPSLHVRSWKKEFHHLLTCYNAGTQVSASLLMLVVRIPLWLRRAWF